MKFFVLILLGVTMRAQSFRASVSALSATPSPRSFWTTENKAGSGVLAALVVADGITTQRALNERMREANPLMRPFVTRGAAGEAAGSALGFGTAVGVVYLLHRTRHNKAERAAMWLMVAGEAGFVANNIVAIH